MRRRVGQVGVGIYAYSADARSGRPLISPIMMTIQSIWFLVALAVCVIVSLALALSLWLMAWDPESKTHDRPTD